MLVKEQGLEDYKPELSDEELDFLDGWIEDCGGDEEWSESWDGYRWDSMCLTLSVPQS